ncbi:MAG: MBG domain-containing protein [Cyclobacteriaceae bacterium]
MKFLVTLFLALFTFTATSQDYFWVGGTGNWSDFANHWATTSGGSTFHTSAPTSTNDVYFDANSFTTSGQSVTIDVEADCQSMDWTGVTNFPSALGNGNDLNIYGSLTLASDMTADFSDVEFESTLAGNTITSNGTSLGSGSITRFNGVAGEWTLQDNFQTNSLYLSAGTLTTNGNDIDAGSRFNTTGAEAKVINLGSSEITAERWWIQGTNQTINAGTSKIIVSSFYGDTSADGPFTYYDVEFYNYGVLRNSNSFNDITVPAGLQLELQSGDVFTIENLIADGTKHDPISIYADTEGSEATFSKAIGAVTLSYIEMQDVHGVGGATFTANETVDDGNNTGWMINAITGQDYFWIGDGGDWTDFANHWATTSGGSTMHTDYPDKLDNVYFDANSFTLESQTVNQDLEGGVNVKDMDWTGALHEPTLNSNYQHNFKVYGSVTFIDEMTRSLYGFDLYGDEAGLSFDGSGSGNITFLSFRGSGEYDLLSDISVASFNHREGTINYNDVSITCSIDFDLGSGSNSPIANFGNTTVSCRDFTKSSSSTPVITGTPTITISRDFQGNGISIHEVIMTGVGEVLGSNTLEHFTVEPGSAISFEAGETQTFNQSLTLDGTKSSPTNISSNSVGVQSTFSMNTVTIDAIYLVLQDMDATGGATFNATQTIDNGNNTGWNITGLVGADYYWVGDGGNWTDFANHWATASGGSTMHTDEPGVLDNAIFDANSFTMTGQTVLVDGGDISFNDITWTGVSNEPTFDADGNALNVYGSFDFDPNMTMSVDDVYFLSSDPETITLEDDAPGTNSYFHFTGEGSWTFQSGFTVRELNHHSGDLDFNGQSVHIDFSFDFFGTDVKNVTLGASDFFTRSMGVGGDNLTFDGSASTITSSSSFSTLGGSGNSFSFNDFKFIRYNSTDEGILSADMTFNTLTLDAGTDIELRAGITITVNDLVAVGTADDPIAIYSVTQGSTATISQASGTVEAFYLELEDITATGGATFNAFSSLDNGNVTGWTFFKNAQTISFTTIDDVAFGVAPFALSATATSGLDVEFSVVSGPATISGEEITITGAGTVQVKAEQAGDIDYDPAPSVINTFEVSKADQVITFDALNDRAIDEPAFDLTATGGDSGEPVTFESSDPLVATISGSTVTIVALGTTTITASQAGNDDYNAASDVMQDLTIVAAKMDQVITFGALADKVYGDDPFDLTATASSLLEVSYSSSNESVATISGSTVTIVGVGTTTITASQGGDGSYDPAPDVEQSLLVEKADQIITFEALETVAPDSPNFGLTATSTSGLSISYVSSDESVATVSGSNVFIVGIGSTVITASQAGNDLYNPAVDVEQTLIVGKASQEITFEALASKVYGDAAFDLTATAGSGLTVDYVSSDESVATIAGNTVTIIGTGITTITASQSGDDAYEAAVDVDQDLTVERATLTVTADDKDKIYGDANPTLTVVYDGFVNGDDETALNTVPTVSTTATAATETGEHPINLAGGSADNYTLNLVEGILTIDKRALTATADDIYMREGDVVPELTISYAELVNGDSGSDIDIPPAIATAATSTSPVGTYDITLSGGEDNNYTLTLEDGFLTIDEPLAVDEISNVIQMYPNPVHDYLYVQPKSGEEYQLEIRTLTGQLIEAYLIKSEKKIDLTEKPAGIYLLILKESDNVRAASRLIVE